ncbi:hypothetical protein [Paenisporosarcina cavernae]|uniref:Uncharacterized protein n=1 Tax=Paenisporosarcina cavernae TaxID=2320858 RepID=A0A385YZF1_9BACL|nr:hypothetical protein [Paenisporosarcina cavernae]AYC30732.1 hypothetical protein D3873_00635 [Paenisporosarcina cavernae]
MIIISVVIFFMTKGPDASLTFIISAFSILSILGIIFAILSKQWFSITIGVLGNGIILVFAGFLLLAKGIGG